ncbi:MAG: alpha/beta hydrolase [Actinobacteria bacterium]|nr:alpha/beta hydrolase [Actinomycetota bacterium]
MDSRARRQQLYRLLGDLPDRSRPISAVQISEEQKNCYVLEKLILELNGLESVPAYFVRPCKQQGPAPAILYNHAHGGDYVLGKDELLMGREILQQPSYAEVLTQMGCSALCIDTWAFGERRGRSEAEIFKQMLWSGQVMWGMMVYDSLRAIDYLVSRPEVDAERIGTMGMSMGSTMAWWLAALDTRIKVCVDICCLTDFQGLIDSRGLDGHGIYYYVPNLLKHFSGSQINALIVPRAHLSLAGNFDQLTPPTGLDRIDTDLKKAYAAEAVPEAWRLLRYDTGHFETAAMRAEIISFLETRL